MFKILIKTQWLVKGTGQVHERLPQLLDLLTAMDEEGHLTGAAQKLGISYRHAWRLVKLGSRIFGAPLVTMTRGRGTTLTLLGTKLLWANKRVGARLEPILDSLASELEVEIERALTDTTAVLRIHASHGFAVETLRDFLAAKHVPIDLKYRGSMEALASLCRSNCELAGFHVPIGDLQPAVLSFCAKWLKPDQLVINLATRRQGIIVPHGNPRKILSIRDLAQPGLRLVNRQLGSGTRVLLDLLLKRHNVDSRRIVGYDTGELTHAAVAAYIASGMADAGLGLEVAAKRFNLGFVPTVTERYFFGCQENSLASPVVAEVLKILSSPEFKAAVNGLPGYDACACGTVMRVAEAFADLPSERSKRRGLLTAAQKS